MFLIQYELPKPGVGVKASYGRRFECKSEPFLEYSSHKVRRDLTDDYTY